MEQIFCLILQLVTRLASDTTIQHFRQHPRIQHTRRRRQTARQCSSQPNGQVRTTTTINLTNPHHLPSKGGVAQMVERSLSMREVPGSIPGASTDIFMNLNLPNSQKSGKHSAHVFFFAVCSRAQNLESGNFPLLRRISLLKWVQGSSHLEIRTSLHEVA